MNAHCKRRNKSSYRKYIVFHRNFLKFCLTGRIFQVTENFLQGQEIASCDRKCFLLRNIFPVTGNSFFLPQNFIQWQKISSCEKKVFFLLRQQISSCDRKFLPETGNFFLWQEISSCELSKKSHTFVVILRYDEKSRSFVAILYQIHSRCFKRNYLLEN